MGSVWKTATIDIDRDTEFSGDDADRFSNLVDLGWDFQNLQVLVPALSSSGAVSIYTQKGNSIATVPFQIEEFDADATGSFAHASSSSAGSISLSFKLGGIQYFRVHVAANQAADREFECRGY